MAEHGGHGGGGGGILRELLAVFSFGVDTDELEHGAHKLDELKEKLAHVAEAVLAAFAVEAVHEFVEGQVEAMHAVERTSLKLGISTEKVQELQFAAQSLGEDAGALLSAMGRLQVAQQAAAQGSGAAAQLFDKLGIKVRDAGGQMKSADELMLDVADAISHQSDASKQAAIATQIFGRSGRELLPLLKEGREGFEQYADEFKRLGGGYDEATLGKGKEFEKQQARLKLAMTSLKSVIVGAILPAVSWLVGKIASGVAAFRKWQEGTRVLQIALIGLGAVLTAMAAPALAAIAPYLLMAAAIGAVVLVVEDLIGLFEGKDSLIGRAIDHIWGKGVSLEVVTKVREIWQAIANWITDAVHEIKLFKREMETGPDFSERIEALHQAGEKAGARGAPLGERLSQQWRAFITGAPTAEATSNPDYAAMEAERKRRLEAAYATQLPGAFATLGRALIPGMGPPALAPQLAGAAGAVSVAPTINVEVQAPAGTDPKRFGAQVGEAAADAFNRQTRGAAATFQRGTP